MKLDKTVEPLAKDTTIAVRPRSALGLKYVEITPGKSDRDLQDRRPHEARPGARGPGARGRARHLPAGTRRNSQAALEGFGDAFTGRGASINSAIEALNPLFTHLTPVMRTLNDPDTELDQFFLQIGRASAQVAPVAKVQADLFANMATTFEAMSRDPRALQATIEKSPSTMDVAVRSFRVQRPVLRRLRRPLAAAAPGGQRAAALAAGDQPRLRRRHPGAAAHGGAQRGPRRGLRGARRPVREPEHADGDPRPAHHGGGHAARRWSSSPPTRRCAATGTTSSTSWASTSPRPAPGGTVQNQGVKTVNGEQPNTIGNTSNSRAWDLPADGQPDPTGFSTPDGPYGATFAGRARGPRVRDAVPAGDRRPGQRRLPERPDRPAAPAHRSVRARLRAPQPARRDAPGQRPPGRDQQLPGPVGRHLRVAGARAPTTCRTSTS